MSLLYHKTNVTSLHFQQCRANGFSFEKMSDDLSAVASLEVFFSGYPRMVGLSLFPKLLQLTIVSQSISHLQGLEGCPLLQELWVAECQLTVCLCFIGPANNTVQKSSVWFESHPCETLLLAEDRWTAELLSAGEALPIRQSNQ